MYINIKVLGGLPVEIYADNNEWYVVAIAGRWLRKLSHANWIYNRVNNDDVLAMIANAKD